MPNGSLHRYYGAAKIVLNDHWPDMAAKGFVSNRIFDAGLSEAFVISAAFQGAELFEGSIVTYQTVDELKRAADRWLADDVGRRQRARTLRELVLAAHTFDHRAAAITEVVERLHERRARGPADAPPA